LTGVASVLTLLILSVWGGSSLFGNLANNNPQTTQVLQSTATATLEPTKTSTPSPTQTAIPPTPTPKFRIGSTVTGKDGMVLLYVPAGEFVMGGEDNNDQKPIHTVYLDAFWIDQTEITNAMYAECEDAGVCEPPVAETDWDAAGYYKNPDFNNYPVVFISWYDASTYCSWTDRRLLTEAEWEKAASWNDNLQQKNIYPWGDVFSGSYLNFCDKNCASSWADANVDDGYEFTAPVGSYLNGASPYGVLNMAGNVEEWVGDWYDAYPGNDESSPRFGDVYRVVRGSSYYDDEYAGRSTYRGSLDPALDDPGVGFRCGMDAE